MTIRRICRQQCRMMSPVPLILYGVACGVLLMRLTTRSCNHHGKFPMQLVQVPDCAKEHGVTAEHFIRPTVDATHINDKLQGYLVYECSTTHSGRCGGWSDRLSGILSSFVIALLTNRRFMIHHDKPCNLTDYFTTGLLDWRYDPSILIGRSTKHHDFKNNHSFIIRSFLSGAKNISTYFRHDVNFVRMNWDFTDEFRKRPSIGREIPWMTKLHYADIYQHLLTSILQPSQMLVDAIRSQIRTRAKTACAHVRVGNNPNMPTDRAYHREKQSLKVLWAFMDLIDKDVYDIFIASDADSVKEAAKSRYPDNIIDTEGRITHIDRPAPGRTIDPCEGFLKQLLDYYMMASCDILIVADSGFSITAAYLRDNSNGLYCWRGEDIRPCSRYTVHNTFSTGILAP